MLRAAMPKRVVLETDLPEPGPVVNGNANQLQLMLNNLVTNAWESVGELEATVQLTLKTGCCLGHPGRRTVSRRGGRPATRPMPASK